MRRIWVDWEKCMGCKSCEVQCAIERDSVSKTLLGAIQEVPRPIARIGVTGKTNQSFPLQCRHCQDAPCLRACPSGAMQRQTGDDIIVVDQAKCRGCWMCVMSCPFGAIAPSRAGKIALKCDTCLHMEEPACVNACPTGALLYGEEAAGQVLSQKQGRLALFFGQCPGAAHVALRPKRG